MQDYETARRDWNWDTFRSWLDYLPGQKLNIAYEAVDRHVLHGRGNKEALRWFGKSGERKSYTYADLKRETDRFARMLTDRGFGPRTRVYSLLGRVPELYIAALGTLKAGAVFCPLYSAFGPEPVRSRMAIGKAEVLLAGPRDYAKKVAPARGSLPNLKMVLLTPSGTAPAPDTVDLAEVLANTPAQFECAQTDPQDMALLHFTSGTTGTPKGAVHVHEAVIAHNATGRIALDLHEDDIYWCTADPGWVTGTSYGIIAPLCAGATMIVEEAEFDAERWYALLEREKVTVWYTAPTAIRLLMRAGADLPKQYDLSRLRFLASVGEPLNAEAVTWSAKVFGTPFHDNWWQTETGGIMIANYAAMDVKPGSMGKPLPAVDAAIVEIDNGGIIIIDEPNIPGQLALRAGWPSMFRTYLDEQQRYDKTFRKGWYLTGDLAMRDEDGYFWFVGRADDVIKSAGHLIGPFEVESALVEHIAVAEAAVIGIPDERAGEIVKAFVTLHHGFEPTDELRKDLLGHARKKLGSAIAPRQIEIADDLPRTRSGKIMRRLLKAREIGLPEGDISTLETPT
ncbi:acetate--CoA ligase [Erythrobacter insulae]|uniref:acetate--CoA ligase n=1 Tax=Erythrobacter insulae TaxID=2584124 RepID=A0A547PF26_9SPHN|nr:acetate--CoA ligase [Erythrobacter insulae]TRD12753.1 acetate--CoA ligase [Erythrobacter insulae]